MRIHQEGSALFNPYCVLGFGGTLLFCFSFEVTLDVMTICSSWVTGGETSNDMGGVNGAGVDNNGECTKQQELTLC